MKINKTKDYDKFKFVGGNRNIDVKHVKGLIDSLNQVNMLELNPIIVNEKFEVIDGQHRLEAVKFLGLPVYYIISQGARLPEVVILNTQNKNWGYSDYLESHIQRGKRDYILVKQFIEAYKMPITLALELLTKDSSKRSRNTLKFKQGNYSVDNLAEADNLAQLILSYREYTEGKVYLSREFVRAIRYLMKQRLAPFDPDILLKKLKLQGKRVQSTQHQSDMLRQLEDIYNFHNMRKVRFF